MGKLGAGGAGIMVSLSYKLRVLRYCLGRMNEGEKNNIQELGGRGIECAEKYSIMMGRY